MVGQVLGEVLELLNIGYIRWSTHEAPERPKGEWQAPKEQLLSEVSRTPSGYDQMLTSQSAQVKRRHDKWAFPVPQIIAAAEADDFEPQVFPSYEVDELKYWHTSRIVLIGDAAHGGVIC
jgi:2-polyprenyl-6-methoxyphenol hydroxylase-like FAD-dependent oxidoreductase